MIQITPQLRILVAVEAVDGRKGINCKCCWPRATRPALRRRRRGGRSSW